MSVGAIGMIHLPQAVIETVRQEIRVVLAPTKAWSIQVAK
jgi:hypothetical protein